MDSRYELTRSELAARLGDEPPWRVRQLWDGLYRRVVQPSEMTELPRTLRCRLAEDPAMAPALQLQRESVADRGWTRKWLWKLADGNEVETVLMHYGRRSTVCVSTQAGCAMGCGFCATGQAGFQRNLGVGEIVEQVVRAMRACRDLAPSRRLSNVVFMGMGEPLANYRHLDAAIERLQAGMGLSTRHITISTVGLVPGIRRLAEDRLRVGLAVSLHAANDALRDRLVPVNRRYPLDTLMDACRHYRSRTRRRVSFEWALMDQLNDSLSDAAELAQLARPLGAHVNLIPLNPTPGWPVKGTPPDRVRAFQDALAARSVNATVRRNRGNEIDAACGQLAGRTSPVDDTPTAQPVK
ncbi:MAG TPA: 23S rRNA (adenine(2503)-C(2))-methyltransferase RlmN [Acidimicrobiales bacterium]|nr:23S rRNA (adenine(2503)-C(2))-methyltransferase RlmN [Acidimicrobiales bacterium]